MQFRFLPPSPQDERAARFLLAGTVLALMVIGALLPLPMARGPFQAVLWGAGAALAWSLWRAQHELDLKRKRASRGSIRLARTGVFISDLKPQERVIAFDSIENLEVGPGKLAIHHQGGVETLATREIENVELLIAELKRRVRFGSGASDFIPLSPL